MVVRSQVRRTLCELGRRPRRLYRCPAGAGRGGARTARRRSCRSRDHSPASTWRAWLSGAATPIPDPRPSLWIRGDADVDVLGEPAVAIVGARACSGYKPGLHICVRGVADGELPAGPRTGIGRYNPARRAS